MNKIETLNLGSGSISSSNKKDGKIFKKNCIFFLSKLFNVDLNTGISKNYSVKEIFFVEIECEGTIHYIKFYF